MPVDSCHTDLRQFLSTPAVEFHGAAVVGKGMNLTIHLFRLIFASFIANTCNAGAIDIAAWRDDIDHFARELPKRHKDLFLHLDKATFEADISRLQNDLPKLDDSSIGLRLQQLTAKVGDLHTRVVWKGEARYPLSLAQFGDHMFVTAVASEEYRRLLGAKLVGIGGKSARHAMSAAMTLVSAENMYAVMALLPSVLVNGEAVAFLGMSDGPDSADFHFETGDASMAMRLRSNKSISSAAWIQGQAKTPLHASHSGEFYWSQYIADSRALYVNYSRCEERKDLPFASFAEDVGKAIDQLDLDRVVIDVRVNSGGNEAVIRPLVSELKRRQIKIFVLIGRRTFSSAFGNALTMKEQLGAVLVGEPTGQKPNAFGETRSFELPHSGLRVQYSTKFWKRFATSDPDALYPDLTVEIAIAPYMEGRDPVLEAALRY
ncbi:MAG: hypothetical protein IPP44_00735 [Ideonella sp.]|nr:hypothetical protein [Ideonella sp.]